MRDKLMFFFAGALVALIAVAATRALDAKPSQKGGSHVLLSPEDYIEIQQLYGMYARDVDPGSVRDASWMFTKDAVAIIGGPKPMTTPEEFKTFYAGVRNGQAAGGGSDARGSSGAPRTARVRGRGSRTTYADAVRGLREAVDRSKG